MTEKKITICIPEGQEARPVAMLVQLANQYESKIYIGLEDKKVNAKSIMGMMSIGLASGTDIVLTADGADEEQAMTTILQYLQSGAQ